MKQKTWLKQKNATAGYVAPYDPERGWSKFQGSK